jgi:acetyltransferase-like isoleucine patch superfamily enzyme
MESNKKNRNEPTILASLLYSLYSINNFRMRKLILSLIMKLEKGEFYSKTLRKIFKDYHKIDIGMYTHGGCFDFISIAPYTTIGRYCSIANAVHIFNRDHPLHYKSTHSFFFNPLLKKVKKETQKFIPLWIGNDVWIGYNAVILSTVRRIGDGAVIGAGAVVNKDVPPYAIVVGNPARIVRYRFSPQTINELLTSRWWEKDIGEIDVAEYSRPYEAPENNVFPEEINPEYINK